MDKISSILNSEDFSTALKSGIYRVVNQQENLNSINVFPVADGDTGTNLALSLTATLEVLKDTKTKDLNTILTQFADKLLDSSRGNSGAILTQFFQGMCDSAEGLSDFTTKTFSESIKLGSDYAYDALSEPKEGTILTLISVLAKHLQKTIVKNKKIQFQSLMLEGLNASKTALKETQNQLEELSKAGVVDAGAKGFFILFEGMTNFIVNSEIEKKPDLGHLSYESTIVKMEGSEEKLEYFFCTECIINGLEIDRRKLREEISVMGNSIVLAGTKRKAKLHIHTNEPADVFDIARKYGEVSAEKCDDMRRQQHTAHITNSTFSVITDSGADIPDQDMDNLDIHIVPIRIQFSNRSYLDKVSITPNEFFSKLKNSDITPTTSQPSMGDFRRQYQFLASHFPDVISISLSEKISGTFQAAKLAIEKNKTSGKIHLINSRSLSIGQGLIVTFAAECAQAGLDIATTLTAVKKIIEETTAYALIDDIQYAVRGGRIPSSVKFLTDTFFLTPILKTLPNGNIKAKTALFGKKNVLRKYASYIEKNSPKNKKLRIAIGHALCQSKADELQNLLFQKMDNILSCRITDLGSAIGVHGGPGALVVGVQNYHNPNEFKAQ